MGSSCVFTQTHKVEKKSHNTASQIFEGCTQFGCPAHKCARVSRAVLCSPQVFFVVIFEISGVFYIYTQFYEYLNSLLLEPRS